MERYGKTKRTGVEAMNGMRIGRLLGGPILVEEWCDCCDRKTIHQVQFVSDTNFVGKLYVCSVCNGRIRQPPIGATGVLGE